MRKIIIATIVAAGLIALIAIRFLLQENPAHKPLSAQETKDLLMTIYKDVNAFTISDQERKLFEQKNQASTYGEITPDALEILVKELNPTRTDIFYDLGSGKGQAPLYMALHTPMKKCTGIELASTRHHHALDALDTMLSLLPDKPTCELAFYEGDFTDPAITFDDATIVWMNSTCYPDSVMTAIAKRLSTLKPGLRVISLKQLPTPEKFNFKLIKELKLPMTWSNAVDARIYVLERNVE